METAEYARSVTPEIGKYADKTSGIVTTADVDTDRNDETDESNEEYGGILSLRWPVDHETTCGLCGTSLMNLQKVASVFDNSAISSIPGLQILQRNVSCYLINQLMVTHKLTFCTQ